MNTEQLTMNSTILLCSKVLRSVVVVNKKIRIPQKNFAWRFHLQNWHKGGTAPAPAQRSAETPAPRFGQEDAGGGPYPPFHQASLQNLSLQQSLP